MEDHLTGRLEGTSHILDKRVYYSDTDAGGVVYHSRYIDMAEHARSELIRLLGGEQHKLLKDEGIGFVVRSLTANYLRPAFLDDTLTIRTSLKKCETFTLVFLQEICREEEVLCDISLKAGCVSLTTGRPTAMPGEWRDVIRQKMMD